MFVVPRVLNPQAVGLTVVVLCAVAFVLLVSTLEKDRLVDSMVILYALLWLVCGTILAKSAYFIFIRPLSSSSLNEFAASLLQPGKWTVIGFLWAGLVLRLVLRSVVGDSQRLLSLTDSAYLVLPLLQVVGRTWCFFNGCCYGVPLPSMSQSFGVLYSTSTFAGRRWFGVPLYPVQAYEVLLLGVLTCLLLTIRRLRSRVGTTTAAYFIGYGLIRIALQPLKQLDSKLVLGTPGLALGAALMVLVGALLLQSNRQLAQMGRFTAADSRGVQDA